MSGVPAASTRGRRGRWQGGHGMGGDTRGSREQRHPRPRRLLLPVDSPPGQLSAGRALSQFAIVGILVLVMLASTGLFALHHVAVDEEVAQARWVTEWAYRYG